MDTDLWHVGGLLKQALRDRGITQTELARRTGYTLKHINEVLNGKAHATPPVLQSWAAAIGLRLVVGVIPR